MKKDNNIKKDNNVLKFFTPTFAIIYTITIIFIAALPLNSNEPELKGILMSSLLQLIGIVITLFICRKIYPKIFENPNNCKFEIPSPLKFLGIFLIVPFVTIIFYDINYSVFFHLTNEEIITKELVSENIFSDIIMGISAVFLSPIAEELGFRFMTISPFKKKHHQIIVLIFISFIFGFLHVKNFLSSFTHSLFMYGTIFVATQNITYSIIIHSAFNFYALLFEILSSLQIITIKMIEIPSILLFDKTSHIVCGTIFIVGVIMLLFSKKDKS